MNKININNVKKPGQSRRAFIKNIAVFGSLTTIIPGVLTRAEGSTSMNVYGSDFEYKFKTISVEHIKEIKDWFKRLKENNKLSSNETYSGYIDFDFDYKKTMAETKSIVLVAIPQKIASVTFNYKNHKYDVLIPTGYVDDNAKLEDIKTRIRQEITKDTNSLLEIAGLPYKTLAVRSGLAQYGLNNITFVEGYGSFHRLLGFYTNIELDDNWGPLKTMRLCKGCAICKKSCPTDCIRENNFVIDVDKCIPLYNEVLDPIPEWIDTKVHHTMVGCLKCQWDCPANTEGIKIIENLADISAEETALILSNRKDEKLQKSITDKLIARYPSVKYFDYFRRNTSLALANILPS